jgi:hypothetical protein
MAKTSGSFANIVQGVSQQVAHNRGPGQCTEQINLIPDPVIGLTRRHGSIMKREDVTGYDVEDLAAITADTASFRSFEYSNAGVDYTVLYRTAAKAAGSPLPPLIVYNRNTSQFLTYTTRSAIDDPIAALLDSGGVSAITSVGKYVFLAGHSVVPTATVTDLWDSEPNRSRAVVWVRGGAYARTYTVKATSGGTEFEFSYKTPTSSYPGTLDTSGVPVYAADPAGGTTLDTEAAYIVASCIYGASQLGWASWNPTGMVVKDGTTTLTNVSPSDPAGAGEYRWDAGSAEVRFHVSMIGQLDVTMAYTHTKTITNPNYAKIVGDITNEYNTAVTQWIGSAAEAITPAAIAEELRQAAVDAGLTSGGVRGGHLVFSNVQTLVVDDGGDGTLMRGVANEVNAIDQVSALHYVGKVVKVRAAGAQEAFYLKALPKNPDDPDGMVSEVLWVEGAGAESEITSGILYGTIDVGTGASFCVAGSADNLDILLGTPGATPQHTPSSAGDSDTAPLPHFVGRKISYLGVFQDRLLIGSDAVLRVSKTSDYLNLFRSTLLTVPNDDPFEMLSQGSDDDELRFSQLYNRDLVLFGKKRQYVVSGTVQLTPTNANMATMSSHANAADLPPLATGGVVFYGKLDEGSSSVHQIQPGLVADSPESFVASGQLDNYIGGAAIELEKSTKPPMLFVRATAARNSLFTFRYLDQQDGRKQDAWGRWDFDEVLGPIIGMQSTIDGLLVFFVREAFGELWLVADLCPLLAGLSSTPYFDSQRPWSHTEQDTGAVRPSSGEPWSIAFDNSSEFFLIGSDLDAAETLLAQWPSATGPWVGAAMNTQFTPTNPVIRDRNGEAITVSNLTITKFVLSMAQSSGFVAEIEKQSGTTTTTFNGRILGDPNNLISRIPVTEYQRSVPVGENTRKFDLNLRAITWLPFTITAVEWVGQWFNRTQRF